MSSTFTFYVDPSHAWLQVTRADLRGVNLRPEDFTRYSYREGSDIFYLEEDCDATKFLVAYRARHGHNPTLVERYHAGDSPVRRLPRLA